jgi:pyridinium-3,5-biscarboxylic acid mononucleotide sulfurtransferase
MIDQKINILKGIIEELGSVVIAYSGGIDSTFLAKISYDVLAEKALAVTGHSDVNSSQDLNDAKKYADLIGINHLILPTEEVNSSDFNKNDKNRCFYCKTELFSKCLQIAKEKGYSYVIEGSNFDDLNDYRPGMKASCDLNIKQPIVEAEITKDEIREYLRSIDYPIWNKPASPCLSSRIPYGNKITGDKLRMVEDGEIFLRKFGFYNMRVRHHDKIARIEVDVKDFNTVTGNYKDIVSHFNTLGFDYVTLDLKGFRTGSLNEVIETK